MNTKKLLLFIALGAFTLSGSAIAAQVDVIDATDAQAGTYFVPTDAQKYDSGFWRGDTEDWDWTHNGLAGAFTTATLNISAFDVDFVSTSFPPGERDEIFAYDTDTLAWLSLGYLSGGDGIWQFTAFSLNASLFNEVTAGLQVRMDIDKNNDGWLVTLAKSTLTTDGAGPGNPNPPGVPDSGATALLIGLGLGALQLVRRQRA